MNKMCGRYYLYTKLEKLLKRYGIKDTEIDFSPQKEIFPSQQAPVVLQKKNSNKKLKSFKWGFAPSFASRLIINARSETIEKKPTFRKSFYQKRCLVPVTGFFEWKTLPEKKVKYKINLKEKDIFSLAGIYDDFKNEKGETITSFCILTTDASKKLEEIHQRMPVILNRENEEKWLNPDIKNTGLFKNFLNPFADKFLNIKKSDI